MDCTKPTRAVLLKRHANVQFVPTTLPKCKGIDSLKKKKKEGVKPSLSQLREKIKSSRLKSSSAKSKAVL